MNLDKINQVNEELAQLSTITDKLNHWKIEYLVKYNGNLHEYFELKTAEENGSRYNDYLSGPLNLPINQNELVHELHSPSFGVPKQQRIEYYRWMLYFLAEERFKNYTKAALLKKYSTPLGKVKLQGRINQISQIQRNAEQAVVNGTIAIQFTQQPSNEELYLWYADDLYLRVEVPISSTENPYVVSVCEHKFVLPFLKELQRENKKEIKKTELFRLIGIDNKKLVSELIEKEYISEDDRNRMTNWFKGIILAEPIHINKPMCHFVSLIADLKESSYIKNTKTFCKNLIHTSLLFDNEVKSPNSIKNALNENAPTRIHKTDKGNNIDIKDFIKNK